MMTEEAQAAAAPAETTATAKIIEDSSTETATAPSASSVSISMPQELTFLHYASKLKHLPRTGWVNHGINKPETVSGHMYRMAIFAGFLINDPMIDTNKCMKLSLVHDFGESIIGDITPNDPNFTKKLKQDMECEAMEKLARMLHVDKGFELLELFNEYEFGTSPEAHIVRHLDKFDMVLQAYEYEQQEGKPKFLQDFFDSTKGFFDDSHPTIKELADKLFLAREKNVPFERI